MIDIDGIVMEKEIFERMEIDLDSVCFFGDDNESDMERIVEVIRSLIHEVKNLSLKHDNDLKRS